MASRLRTRLVKLEAAHGGGDGYKPPRVIFMLGGGLPFPGAFGVPNANGGRTVVKRKRGESESAFEQRVADMATEAGAGRPVIVPGIY